MDRFNYWETLFLHDQQMYSTLRKFNSLIGASHEAFYGNNKIFPKPLIEMIIEIQSEVEQKIMEIEKSITK